MDLFPYQSVGPLQFGMTPDDVARILGSPRARSKNFLGEIKFVYPGFNVEFSKDEMVEVTFSSSQELSINGQSVFATKDGRDAILAMSKDNYRGNGSIVLTDIGVAIPDEDGPPFPITIFARGRMRPLLSRYERI
jgi:hypothetical protein